MLEFRFKRERKTDCYYRVTTTSPSDRFQLQVVIDICNGAFYGIIYKEIMGSYRPITDTWLLAPCKHKYYGGYPAGFLERARLVLVGGNPEAVIWHVCGGEAKKYNGVKGGVHLTGFGNNDITIDIDPECMPDILYDVRYLDEREITEDSIQNQFEFYSRPDAIIIDRPYTPRDAAMYRCGPEVIPELNKLVKDCLKLVKPNGLVGVLDYKIPQGNIWSVKGMYPVIAGTNCNIRCFTIGRAK